MRQEYEDKFQERKRQLEAAVATEESEDDDYYNEISSQTKDKAQDMMGLDKANENAQQFQLGASDQDQGYLQAPRSGS